MRIRWKWILIGISVPLVLGIIVVAYLMASSYDFNTLKPMIARAVKDATGRNLVLGQMTLKIGLTPVLIVEDVRFQNPAWASRPDLLRIRSLQMEVAFLALLRKKIEIKRLILLEPDIQFECDRSGLSNLDFSSHKNREKKNSAPFEVANLRHLSFRDMILENGRVCFKNAGTGKTLLVSVDSLEAAAKSFSTPIMLKVKGSHNRKRFEAQAFTGSLEQLVRQDEPWPLNATVLALNIEFRIEGSLNDVIRGKGFSLSINAKGNSTAQLAKLADLRTFPEMGPFWLAATFSDPTIKKYRVSDLRLSIKGSEVSGTLEIDVAGKKPNVSGRLSSKRIDLRPLIFKKTAASEEKKNDRVFSEKPFSVDLLKKLDGHLKIQVKEILTQQFSIHDLSADALLKQGGLSLKPLKAVIGGGLIDGLLECRSEGKETAIAGALKIEKIDMKRMLRDLGLDDAIEGSIDAEAVFNSSGDSMGNLMANLTGKSIVTIENGKIKNQHIRVLGGELGLTILRVLGVSDDKRGGYTHIQCAVQGLEIKDGLAMVTALVVDTPDTTVYGAGDVDLKTERLNLSFEPLPKRGVAGLSLSISELTKPFKLSGTLSHPSIAVDLAKTALTLGKAIGGLVLIGPFGLAGALAGRTSEQNPCATALEAAKRGAKATDMRKGEDNKGLANWHETDERRPR